MKRPHPETPPCGGPCSPEGCFSDRCWQDRDADEEIDAEWELLWGQREDDDEAA